MGGGEGRGEGTFSSRHPGLLFGHFQPPKPQKQPPNLEPGMLGPCLHFAGCGENGQKRRTQRARVPLNHPSVQKASERGSEAAEAARLFTVKATRQLPILHVTKDFGLYACKDESLHRASRLDLEPCELFGFNLGDLAKQGGTPKTRSPKGLGLRRVSDFRIRI